MAKAKNQQSPPVAPVTDFTPNVVPVDVAPMFSNLKKAIVLCLTVRMPGAKKKVNVKEIQTAEDFELPEEDSIHISKDLFNSPEMKKVRVFSHTLRKVIQTWALPTHFKGGMYAIPIMSVDELDAKLQIDPSDASRGEHEKKFWQCVEEFLASYPQRCVEAPARLKSLYNASEYPSVEQLRGAFDFKVSYIDFFGVPDTLKEISKAMWQREREKAVSAWTTEAEKVKEALREGMAALVESMVECLSETTDGKPMTFRAPMVAKMEKFFKAFPAKNDVIGDTDLANLVVQAEELLQGVNPEQVRKNENGAADRIREGFLAIKAQLSDHLQAKPVRKFRFGKGEAATQAVDTPTETTTEAQA